MIRSILQSKCALILFVFMSFSFSVQATSSTFGSCPSVNAVLQTYEITFNVKDSNGNSVEGAEISLEDHGMGYTDSLGIYTYQTTLTGSFAYEVSYPIYSNAAGTISANGSNLTEVVNMVTPDYFYHEEFPDSLPSGYITYKTGTDFLYWFGGKVIFFRQSGTLDPLMLVSPPFDIGGNNGGSIIFSLGGISATPPEAGFGTIDDPSDTTTIKERGSYFPQVAYSLYTYDLQSFAGTTDPLYFYWNHKSSATSWFDMEYVIITEGIISSVETQMLKEAKVFPNPTSDYINIQLELPIKEVSIYDTMGRLVDTKQVNNAFEYVLNTASYDPGLYSLVIHSSKGKITKSVVIMDRH